MCVCVCVCAGLMVLLGMFGTFLHCNHTITAQVALKVIFLQQHTLYYIIAVHAHTFNMYSSLLTISLYPTPPLLCLLPINIAEAVI